MGIYASTTKERGTAMPKKMVLEFPVDLPEASLQNKEAIRKGKETIVLELLRKEKISQGKAAELLGIDRHTLFDLMAKYDVAVIDMREGELKEELKKDLEAKALIHPVKANAFLKNADIVSIGGDAVEEANHYDE